MKVGREILEMWYRIAVRDSHLVELAVVAAQPVLPLLTFGLEMDGGCPAALRWLQGATVQLLVHLLLGCLQFVRGQATGSGDLWWPSRLDVVSGLVLHHSWSGRRLTDVWELGPEVLQ